MESVALERSIEMYYFGEELGATWLRDNSAYHEAQRHHPLCGSIVVITDRDCKEYGRTGVITKVTDGCPPSHKVTLKQDRYGEEFIYLEEW